jgi:separase
VSETLISGLYFSQILGHDTALAQFCPQYRATLHIWLALHAHRREDTQQTSLVAHHSEEGYKILKSLLAGSAAEPTPKVNKSLATKNSPKQGVVGKGKTRATTGRRGAAVKSSRNVDPVTPMPRKGEFSSVEFTHFQLPDSDLR